MTLGWSRRSHAGQDGFGQGRTSRSAQEGTTDSGLTSICCLLPSHSRALFYQQISGCQSPAAVGVLQPQPASCSRGTRGHGLVHRHGPGISGGSTGGVRVGYSAQSTAVSLSGRGKGLGKDEAPRYPIPLARLMVNESLPES